MLINRYIFKRIISNSVLAIFWYNIIIEILKYCNLQQELHTSSYSFYNKYRRSRKTFNINIVSIYSFSKFFRRQYFAIINNRLFKCNAINIECSSSFNQTHPMLQSNISFHEKTSKENKLIECWLTCISKNSKQNS